MLSSCYTNINLYYFYTFSTNRSETGEISGNLLDGDFTIPSEAVGQMNVDDAKPSSALLDLNWSTNSDFLSGDFMPSKLIQDNLFDIVKENGDESVDNSGPKSSKESSTKENQVSWLSLFAELDPLANNSHDDDSGNRA